MTELAVPSNDAPEIYESHGMVILPLNFPDLRFIIKA